MGRKQRFWGSQKVGPGPGSGCLILMLMGMWVVSLPAQGAQSPRFEADVLPIFEQHCLQCHSAEAHQGGLSLETLDDVLRGGDSGAVVVANKSLESRLLTMITSGSGPRAGAGCPGGYSGSQMFALSRPQTPRGGSGLEN